MIKPQAQITLLRRLQLELWSMFAIGSGFLLSLYMAITVLEDGWYALRWLVTGFACWGFVIWQCRKRLHLNQSTVDGTAFSSLGHGNHVTLLRGLLIAATAGFIIDAGQSTHPVVPFLPAVFYSLAALGDALDGYLARRQRQTTVLGQELDTSLDALGLLLAPLLAVLYGYLHVSYLLVSVAYYLFQWGLYWRQRHSKPVYGLPPSTVRRFMAGAQMAVVAVALWPPVPSALSQVAGIIFMVPLLVGFCRDWLHVSGRRG